MTANGRSWLLVSLLLVAATAVFCAGITWGLPSREIDRYLFGDELVWSGEKIQRLAGERTEAPTRGADADVDPLANRGEIIRVNETDEQRAEILRRYRLYTHQPDEMVTMMALARMRPGRGDLDPKMYQYGGLWIYPVGAALKVASACGAIALTTDLAYYLDHPEAFGRFYVVARLYVAAWAVVGVWAVFWIVRRLTGGCVNAAAAGAALYIAMPVVVNMAHEAKPHLPGVVLMLLAVMAAMRYVETGRRGWWIATACLWGAAFGMVLSAWPVFVVLPVMTLMRRQSWPERIVKTLVGVGIGGVVYFVTNPYVLVNLLVNRDLLRSNLANTRAMFRLGPWQEALPNALRQVGEGTSIVLAVVGAVGAIALGIKGCRPDHQEAENDRAAAPDAMIGTGWLLGAPAILVFVQFAAFAAGQPGEYGRFALFSDVALAIAAVVTARRYLETRGRRWVAVAFLVLTTALPGGGYLAGFVRDSSPETSRTQAARTLQHLQASGASRLGILAEPAPYVLPPVDLFRWQILLLPSDSTIAGGQAPADVLIRPRGTKPFPVYRPSEYHAWSPAVWAFDATPISWASKPFDFMLRKGLLGSPGK